MAPKNSDTEKVAKNEDVVYTEVLDTDDREALERAEQADNRSENKK